ncbi:MAG: EAL domain-containing protein [Thiobacillus sp.]|nr:EAL domain-containing protein [Thiobacillus sp.]
MRAVRFLSLKWKLLLPLTLAVAAGTLVLTWLNDRQIRHATEQARLDSAVHNNALLHFLVRQNERQLTDAGAGLADFLATGAEDSPGLASSHLLQRYWEQLSLNQGFDSLRLYNTRRQLLTGFGNLPPPDALIDGALAAVLETERPSSGLICASRCLFYGISPVLRGGKTVGAVLVTSDTSGLMSAFAQSTGRELAIVAPDTLQAYVATVPELQSGLRDLRFTAPSGAPHLQSALDRSGDVVYAWQKLPALAASPGAPAFVTRKDVSSEEAAITRAFLTNLATGLGVFLAAELILLLSLAWFMRRLNRVSTSLPLLGEGRWQTVLHHLKPVPQKLNDELNSLENATRSLAAQLERLDTASRTQQHELENLVETLSHEHDFITSLLDTAQALILTQDRRGIIRMANHYAENLTGLPESRLVGQDFFDRLLFAPEGRDRRASTLLHFERNSAPLRFEAPLVTPDGPRNIAWILSLIGQETGEESLILSVGIDLTELKSAQARASFLSEYDPLTGLYNRPAFQRRVAHALGEIGGGAVLLVDLDDFKAINDLAGHSAGDAVIQHMADRLRNLDPPPTLAARLGGDEFALFFEAMPDAQLLQIARLLCKGDSAQHIATACVGLALVQDGCNVETLMAHADLALSQARAKGRANWHLYNASDGIRESLLDRTEQLALITDALRQDRLQLYLQPILALQTGLVAHHEVLLRVLGPSGQILAPAPLIAAAESSGLIREIDQWVLRHAIALIAAHPGLRLAVNLSARSLDTADLPGQLNSLLQTYRVPPRQLTLEITETTALDQLADAESLLAGIRALGCKIALDDFGVGFSTFQYLKHLPVDFVKIDGSFIRGLDRSEDDRLFVRALVEAVHSYGKLAVAEYVENAAVLEQVVQLGIDYGQGYHFGRPRPAEDVLKDSHSHPLLLRDDS